MISRLAAVRIEAQKIDIVRSIPLHEYVGE
jgi:hypothetical protein